MAIDSATKRLTMLDFGVGGLPIPDDDDLATPEERAHLLGLYSGIELVDQPIEFGQIAVGFNSSHRRGGIHLKTFQR